MSQKEFDTQPGSPDYEELKREYQPLSGSEFLLNPFLVPSTHELPEVQVAVEWTSAASVAAEDTRRGHERAFNRLFSNLTQQGVAESVVRAEVYAPNKDGLVTCLVVEDSAAWGQQDHFEKAICAHKSMHATSRMQLGREIPWHRVILTFDDIKLSPEAQKELSGDNPQPLAIARMQPAAKKV